MRLAGDRKAVRAWRKSRIAARLLYRKAKGPLGPRDQALARQLSQDPEVENRLIQQALYYLGGARKHDLDRKLVERVQLTVDRTLLSGDVDIFSDNDEDLSPIIREQGLDKERGGFYLEAGFELSFRTSPRWRGRAKTFQVSKVTLTLPHPLDILIGKLDRLGPKDVEAFSRVIAITGHPTAEEMKRELQIAVDLFRPGFDEESPGRFRANTEQLWREVFKSQIDVSREIIAPALTRRKQGYGEPPPDYKGILGG